MFTRTIEILNAQSANHDLNKRLKVLALTELPDILKTISLK